MLNKNTSEPLELKVDNVFFLGSPNYLNVNGVVYSIVFAVKVVVLTYRIARIIDCLLEQFEFQVTIAKACCQMLSDVESYNYQGLDQRGDKQSVFDQSDQNFNRRMS
jgi:hypothetical protein